MSQRPVAYPRSGSPARTVGSSHHGTTFWVLGLLGWAAIAYAAWGVVAHPGGTDPPNFGVWFVGGLLVHDLVVAPIVLMVGVAIRRRVRRGRAAVQAALIVSATLCLFSLPVLLGLGGLRDNPTLLPRNETAGLLVLLAVVWAVTAAGLLVLRSRHRPPSTRHRPAETSGGTRP